MCVIDVKMETKHKREAEGEAEANRQAAMATENATIPRAHPSKQAKLSATGQTSLARLIAFALFFPA